MVENIRKVEVGFEKNMKENLDIENNAIRSIGKNELPLELRFHGCEKKRHVNIVVDKWWLPKRLKKMVYRKIQLKIQKNLMGAVGSAQKRGWIVKMYVLIGLYLGK